MGAGLFEIFLSRKNTDHNSSHPLHSHQADFKNWDELGGYGGDKQRVGMGGGGGRGRRGGGWGGGGGGGGVRFCSCLPSRGQSGKQLKDFYTFAPLKNKSENEIEGTWTSAAPVRPSQDVDIWG